MTTKINGTNTAASPAITGADTDTGLSFGTDTVNINTGGSTRATVASNGFFGVGTTSPTEEIEVTANAPSLQLTSSASRKYGLQSTNDGKFHAYDGTAGANRLTINSSGNLGIGESSPATILHVKANIGDMLRLDRDNAGAVGNQLAFRHKDGSGNFVETASINCVSTANADAGDLRLNTKKSGGSNIETMRLARDGSHARVFMNCTESFSNAMFSLQTNGSCVIGTKVTADNNQKHFAFRNPNGEVGSIDTNGSSTAYNTSSDYRLKENVTAISDGITRLKTLKPSKFNFIGDSKIVDGFLAHEVTAVPEAITGTKDEVDSDNNPVYQGIDQSKLVPLLTAALQEAVAKIEVLETKVAALEAA